MKRFTLALFALAAIAGPVQGERIHPKARALIENHCYTENGTKGTFSQSPYCKALVALPKSDFENDSCTVTLTLGNCIDGNELTQSPECLARVNAALASCKGY